MVMQDIDRYLHWGQLINVSGGDLIENIIKPRLFNG